MGDHVLTFSVSGKLWNRSLVMFDHETEGLWGHIYGRCMEGPLKGSELALIPSVMTTWSDWKSQHPQSTVLALAPVMSNIHYDVTNYKGSSEFVVGVSQGDHVRAWTFPQLLSRRGVINDRFQGTPIVVFLDSETFAATIFDRRLGERQLTFRKTKDGFRDAETDSVWDLLSGKAKSGPLQGEQLTQLPAITSYIQAWAIFHPRSEYWKADQAD